MAIPSAQGPVPSSDLELLPNFGPPVLLSNLFSTLQPKLPLRYIYIQCTWLKVTTVSAHHSYAEVQTPVALLAEPLAAHPHLSLTLKFHFFPTCTQCSCQTHSHSAPPERYVHPASPPHACCFVPCLDPLPLFSPCSLLSHLKVTDWQIPS